MDKQNSPNVVGILDLTDPVKDVYLSVLKTGTSSIDSLIEKTNLQIEKSEVKIYLDILVRQDYLEKYKDNNIIKYRVKGLKRKARSVPKNIWEALKK